MLRCSIVAMVTMTFSPVRGQESGPRYVPIPFEGNFESLFKERLQTAKETTPLRSLWNQIKQNPKKFNLDPAFLNQFDLENPALRKMLTSLVEKQEHGVQIGTLELDGLK